MTVASEVSDVSYAGDGVTLVFAIPFNFLSNSDIQVSRRDAAGDTAVLATGFSITGAGLGSGLCTFSVAPSAAVAIVIERAPEIIQPMDLTSNDRFPAETIETAHDRQTYVSQYISSLVRRSLRFPFGDASGGDGAILPAASSRLGKVLYFNEITGAPEMLVLTDIGGISTALSSTLIATTLDSLKRTAAEISAGVTPANYAYPPLNPLRYGATGNGSTDDTAALNRWIDVLNISTKPAAQFSGGSVFLCGPLNAITADDCSIYGNGGGFKVLADSWVLPGDGTTHVQFTGARTRLENVTFDGNQAAFTSAPTGRLLSLGNDFVMRGVTAKNSGLTAARLSSAGGIAEDCHFDDNANLGLEAIGVSYLKFARCTFNRNGAGYQASWTSDVSGAAFGAAIRYRSHHITFVDCEAIQNARDGMNVNQGSYAIKFIGCLCHRNNDGGFTIAADTVGAPTPGDGESCYDLEYIDCESYNNWASGIAAYDTCHNVSVIGGRYYNNNRVAGLQAVATSYPNGIYFAASSTGINVDTKVYDDRQLRPITAASGTSPRAITATGWVSGTAAQYPRVALYNASMEFQGYGTISSESSGSVSITTTASNGVTLAGIASGWFISQRTQHTGIAFDNGCIGEAHADGFGFLSGPGIFAGIKVASGAFAGGQNIVLPKVPALDIELLANATFDANLTNWSLSTPGGGSSGVGTSVVRSPGAMSITAGSSAAAADGTLISSGVKYAISAYVEFRIWAYAALSGDASVTLFWNAGGVFSTSVTHPGGGWCLLRVGAYMPSNLSDLFPRCNIAIGKTAHFDNGSLRVKDIGIDQRESSPASRYLPL